MTRLIDDLVDFIRTEQNTLELHREFIDVHEFLIALMDEYRTTFDARKVKLSVIAPVGVRVSADHQRLLQVFSNLLDNALKFTPAGGAVTVEATTAAREVRVSLRDNGNGLSEDALRAMFEPPRTLADRGGMGIGLSVARRLAELHGGRLTVSSDGPGRGTEAVVTLPLSI
jgi:signal transduction histidine kinase